MRRFRSSTRTASDAHLEEEIRIVVHPRSQAPAWECESPSSCLATEEEAGASKTLVPKPELGNEKTQCSEKQEFARMAGPEHG